MLFFLEIPGSVSLLDFTFNLSSHPFIQVGPGWLNHMCVFFLKESVPSNGVRVRPLPWRVHEFLGGSTMKKRLS